MTRGHAVGPEPPRGLQEGVEFDLAVAEHVRVGGAAPRVFVEHIVHHALPVLLAQVDEIEGDTDLSRDHFRHEALLFPFAVAVQGALGVVPVLHEHREHVVPLPLEQQGGYAGVHASGKSHANFHSRAKIRNWQDEFAFFS